MKRHQIISGLALLLILGGIVFYSTTRPNVATAPETLNLPPGHYIAHTAAYTIAANYATSTPLSGTANTVAVATMRHFVSDTIAQFIANTPSGQSASTTGAASLQIAYLIGSSAHTISYIFTVYEDASGAHGNLFFKTFTFDTTTGTELSLSDVFLLGSGYLDVLSRIARAKLPAVIGQGVSPQMLERGTTPSVAHFETFFFDNKDFVILFPPYAVAPGAAGPQTLRIPLTDIKNILKPTYR